MNNMALLPNRLRDLRRIWIRFAFRGGLGYSDDFKRMNQLYLIHDPWDMSCQREQYRFAETNRLILEQFGHVGSLLEIGCGEGHQSIYLGRVCDKLTGLDVSVRAVDRARLRYPLAEYFVGDVFSKDLDSKSPFDLVVACEVLYYMNNVPTALRRITALGRCGFVSYFEGQMHNLDPLVLSLPGAISEVLQFKGARWNAVWWTRDQP